MYISLRMYPCIYIPTYIPLRIKVSLWTVGKRKSLLLSKGKRLFAYRLKVTDLFAPWPYEWHRPYGSVRMHHLGHRRGNSIQASSTGSFRASR